MAVAFVRQRPVEEILRRALEAFLETLPEDERALIVKLAERIAVQPGPGAAEHGSLAERIRQHVVTKYIQPARDAGQTHVVVPVVAVHAALGLSQRYSTVVAALNGKALWKQNSLIPVRWTNDYPGKAIEYRVVGPPQSSK